MNVRRDPAMLPFRRPTSRIAPWLVLAALVAALNLAGCARNKYTIEFDPHFSYNVVKTPIWFPGPKKMEITPAELDVLMRRGNPDFIRFWWRADGAYITSSDFSNKDEKLGEEIVTADKSWVYLADKQEIIFTKNRQSYRLVPLDELLALICKYGDPSSRNGPHIVDGEKRETWQWIEYGVQVELVDGKIAKTSYFPATGQGTWGLK